MTTATSKPSSVRVPTIPLVALLATTLCMATLTTLAAPAPARAQARTPYIVEIAPEVDPARAAARLGVTPTLVYREVLNGYAASLTNNQAKRVRDDTATVAVQADEVLESGTPDRIQDPGVQPEQFVTRGISRIGALQSPTAKIDRNDERVDIDVAVIDDGIDVAHPDLNVHRTMNCKNPGKAVEPGDHGTLVGGFIGALDNAFGAVGVAPGARLWAIEAGTRSGLLSMSWILCGLNHVAANADKIDVVNMSFGLYRKTVPGPCGPNVKPGKRKGNADYLHEAICEVHRRGVTLVAAAGNDASSSDTHTPAGYDEVISVSAIYDADGLAGGLSNVQDCNLVTGVQQRDDTFAFFSNFGASVDIAAPGMCISSTYPHGQYATTSGTSFASPIVAGGAALYLATHPDATPAEVKAALLAAAEPGPIPGDPDGFAEGILDVAGF